MSEDIHLTVREAIPEDAEKLVTFVNKTRKQTHYLSEKDPLDETVEEERDILARMYEAQNMTLNVAVLDKDIIGTASLFIKQKKGFAHIAELGIAVDKSYWGFGVGSVLMEELLFWASERRQLKRLELTVHAKNERAIYLYEKFGFEVEAEMAYGIKIGEVYHNVLLMSKIINE